MLRFFFSKNPRLYISKGLGIYQTMNSMPLRESDDKAFPMFDDAALQIVGDSCIQVARAAGDNVDEIGMRTWHLG